MKYHNKWLIGKIEEQENIKLLFFWGHQPLKNGMITKACFSQWWVSSFEIDGIVYPTAEHWMMAGKARLFNDEITLNKIINARTAPEAKKLGREIMGFDPQKWDEEKYGLL